MKRRASTRTRTFGVVLVVAVILLAAYVVAQQKGGTSSLTTSSFETSTASSRTSGPLSSSTPSSSSSSSTSSASIVSSSSSSSSSSFSSSSTSGVSPITHVIVILMENEEYSSVLGNSSAPYENGLAYTYALAANYTAVAHPSLPNYLALVAGSTFAVTTDCLPSQCSQPANVMTVAGLLDSHHLTWGEFAESMPSNCSQTDSPDGLYYPKHDPFVYFGSITGNDGTGTTSAYCDSHVVPLSQFYSDLQVGDLPNFAFITPNICDDAHSCPLSMGDSWLSTFVPKIIDSSSFSSSAVFIVYDEGSTQDLRGGGGVVACILVSPFAKQGYVSQVSYSHYSLLATVEALFDLGNLGRNDAAASPMSDLFTSQAGLSR